MNFHSFRGAEVLVTGGLGFIGSNLALRLHELGARVRVIDSLVPGCGGALENLAPHERSIEIIDADIGDELRVPEALSGVRYVFNLAGEISHEHSVTMPLRDLELNAAAQLRFLEVCREVAPQARVVYASSRQVYGPPQTQPVNEDHPIRPADFNGVHKWAAETYHRLMAVIHGLSTVNLRLTNVYGPRQAIHVPAQGFIGTFARKALEGSEICVFGDGTQLRDMLYVDDVVDAFLKSALLPLDESRHAVFNIGGYQPYSLLEIARMTSDAAALLAGDPLPVRLVPFPPERKRIDIGSYYADDSRFRRQAGWSPKVDFPTGIRRMLYWFASGARTFSHNASHSAH